ncbi:hypothetical protein [Xenorhabdus bovienii]|uniref:hypothetical protein n=1 Tax=Xenorhabdus bovienii TaxID=40576 RepID=UPI002157F362|nr:hypothetical protein [Xenorhabdus bovienii]
MKQLPYSEKVIITNLIDSILSNKELAICVRDEEYVAVKTTRNKEKILSAIGDTELTILKVKRLTGNKIEKNFPEVDELGYILLVHGNGGEVISDYTESLRGMFGLS